MRLITSKVYRAFPELDRFSDERCERFVKFTNQAWGPCLFRWLIVSLASIVAISAGFVAGTIGLRMSSLFDRGRALEDWTFFSFLALALAIVVWGI